MTKLANPEAVAVLGVIVFIIQAMIFIHTRLPNFDEGSYLLKGYLFAQGVYQPFQPYGFWMNKMYMSFYPWGWLQSLTNPGLLTARIFTVFINLISLLGVWIVTRRMGNRWLASGAIWVFALNSSLISIYSLANSQVLVSCVLTWVLVLTIGANRPTWQLGSGMVLAGLLILTRENMVFVLPFLVVYIFWQNGLKKALVSFIILFVVLLIGHIIFWPEIMYLWQRWLPEDLFVVSNFNNSAINASVSNLNMISKLHSMSMALRIHFIALIGSVLLFCLWPKKDGWRDRSHFRAAIFLGVTYAVLLASHAWAALTSRSCIYCTVSYFAFFDIVGILFCIILVQNLNLKPGYLSSTVGFTTIIASVTAIWFSLFEQVGATLLLLPVPRMRNNQIMSGWATLWDILNNKFQIAYHLARMYVPVIFGLLCGILILIIFIYLYKKIRLQPAYNKLNLTSFSVLASLVVALNLSPVTTRPYGEPICRGDVIEPYEQFGAQLETIAPTGSKIYLDGPTTSVLLLYTPGVIILPPQINDIYSKRTSNDSDALLKAGTWNEDIAQNWRDQADIFIIEKDRLEPWEDYLQADLFEAISFNLTSSNCPAEIETAYFVYKRK